MTEPIVNWILVFKLQVHTIGQGSADVSPQARQYPFLGGSMIKLISVKFASAAAFLMPPFEVGTPSSRKRSKLVLSATAFPAKETRTTLGCRAVNIRCLITGLQLIPINTEFGETIFAVEYFEIFAVAFYTPIDDIHSMANLPLQSV